MSATSLKTYLKTLRIIHGALCLGLVLCAGFVYYQNGSFTIDSTNNDLFVYVIPVVALLGYFGSKFLFQKSLQKIKKETLLAQKLQSHLQASILKYAFLEGAGFFSLFAYYNSGNALFLVIALCLILYLYTQKPSLQDIKHELHLSAAAQKEVHI